MTTPNIHNIRVPAQGSFDPNALIKIASQQAVRQIRHEEAVQHAQMQKVSAIAQRGAAFASDCIDKICAAAVATHVIKTSGAQLNAHTQNQLLQTIQVGQLAAEVIKRSAAEGELNSEGIAEMQDGEAADDAEMAAEIISEELGESVSPEDVQQLVEAESVAEVAEALDVPLDGEAAAKTSSVRSFIARAEDVGAYRTARIVKTAAARVAYQHIQMLQNQALLNQQVR
jgi:hypothetical protein